MSENNSKYVDRVGTFRCVVQQPKNGFFAEAGENNTPYLLIPCKVVEEGDQQGKLISFNAWLTDKAFERSIQTLTDVFGWDGNLVNVDNGTYTFAGLECEIVVESEEYEGETRYKAKWLNAAGGVGGATAMAKEKVSSLIKRLGSKSKAIAKATGSAAPRPAAKATPQPAGAPVGVDGADDDDIPF